MLDFFQVCTQFHLKNKSLQGDCRNVWLSLSMTLKAMSYKVRFSCWAVSVALWSMGALPLGDALRSAFQELYSPSYKTSSAPKQGSSAVQAEGWACA